MRSDWRVGLACCATWLAFALVFRISSLAAIVAAASATVWMLLFAQAEMALLGLALTVLVFIRHGPNISRLLSGDEPRIGADK